jgi:hypothetical protein
VASLVGVHELFGETGLTLANNSRSGKYSCLKGKKQPREKKR